MKKLQQENKIPGLGSTIIAAITEKQDHSDAVVVALQSSISAIRTYREITDESCRAVNNIFFSLCYRSFGMLINDYLAELEQENEIKAKYPELIQLSYLVNK